MLSPSSPPRQIFEMLLEETQVMFVEKIGEPYLDVHWILIAKYRDPYFMVY